ncbi:MAG: hypothetical protein C5B56_12860 [Proteobacteria bacterium]|nr:MAG: hypothetical protein C5B56_12860 [Pseudomonadota bacterium]
MAHTVGHTLSYIWPDQDEQYQWPIGIERKETLSAFVAFYEACGFLRCTDASVEEGYEKVVIYVLNDSVTHVALQLEDGSWTSKIGDLADIVHIDPSVVAGTGPNCYGVPKSVLRRARTGKPPTLPPLNPPLATLVNSSGTPLKDLKTL